MKIAVWHNLPSGGGKRALHYQVRGLLERGHQVEAWCPPTADRSYLPLSELVPEHVVPVGWQPRPSRNLVARTLANYTNVLAKLRAMDEHCRACAEQIKRGGFDLLFANGDRDLLVSSIGRQVRGLPKVLYLQEPSRSLYEAMPQLPWAALPSPHRPSPAYAVRFVHNLIKVQGYRVLVREERRNAEAFDAILVNSHYSRESVLRAYGLDSRVCYLGVDEQLFRPLGLQREPFVIGLGAITPAKRVEFVIRAVGHLGSVDGKPPRLVWVGNANVPEYLREMEVLARSLRISFEPKLLVSDDALVALLNTATVLAYAPRLEPFGLAPLEANACELPVVAVHEGGVRETIIDGENGLLVESHPRDMASALRRLLDDRPLAERLGKQGRHLVEEKWSLSKSLDRLEERFREVTAEA